MHCLICPTPDAHRPGADTSDFEALFGRLVLPERFPWWSIDGGSYSPWSFPPEWYGDDERMRAVEAEFHTLPGSSHVLAPAATFGRYMRYLSDFWVDVCAFAERPDAITIGSCWSCARLPQSIGIPLCAAYVFVNVDGSCWAALGAEEGPLREVAQRWPSASFAPAVEIIEPAS